MPAKAVLGIALLFRAYSLASQLLQDRGKPRIRDLHKTFVGARLAGEGGLEYCAVFSGLFAGKPAPTGPRTTTDSCPTHNIVGARLAGEGNLEYCAGLLGLFAGDTPLTLS